MHRFIATFITTMVVLFVFVGLASQPTAAFDPLGTACQQGGSGDSAVCQDSAQQNGSAENPAVNTIKTASTIVAIIAGIASVVMIVLGGISYITSGGNQQQISAAQRRLFGGVIGLVIVAMAWAITTFVVGNFIN